MFKGSVLVAVALAAVSAPALAASLNAGISGTLTTTTPTPVPGVQKFTLSGGFTSYAASPDLPQINGGDLNQYSFTVTGTSQSYDDATRTVVYGGVTGTINGYGQVVQNLSPTTLSVTFDPTFATATFLGTLMSSGSVFPAGFPNAIDFTPANGAVISGLYRSFGTSGGGGSVTGSIVFPAGATAAVPEPASWALMVGGFGLAGGALRRRSRRAVA